MKHNFFTKSCLLIFFSLTTVAQSQITIQTLLNEMVDRDKQAQFPNPEYESLQATSYNRLSTAWDQSNQGTGGWFADSDGTQFIRTELNSSGQTEWVAMEHTGPGCITKMWTPYFYYSFGNRTGPNIRIYLDGSTTPVIDENFIEFLTRLDWNTGEYGSKPTSRNSFAVPSPFADFTARAGNLYLPIPFGSSCKVTFTTQSFFNIINYRAYPAGTHITSYTQADYNAAAATLTSVGTELKSPTNFSAGTLHEQTSTLTQGQSISLSLPAGDAAVRHLEVAINPSDIAADPQILRSTVLKITFDGKETVWCPIGDFFSSTNQLNEMNTWARGVNTTTGKMTCRWVMPYETSATAELINLKPTSTTAKLTVRTGNWTWNSDSMHFYANWRPDLINQGNSFIDINFIDIMGKGVIVGDSWTVLNRQTDWWGEGDEKIYIDDDYDVAKFPTHFGTGTEDYYGWAGGENPTKLDTFSGPFVANTEVGSFPDNTSKGFNIATRARGLDTIPFNTRLRLDVEASPGTGQRNEWDLLMYSSVVFWYGTPNVTHNRPAQSTQAAQPVTTHAELQTQSDLIRNGSNLLRIPNAIEAEALGHTDSGVSAISQTPGAIHSPETTLSEGKHLYIPFTTVGQYTDLAIIEQFNAKMINIYLTKFSDYGKVNIYVNGVQTHSNFDLYSASLKTHNLALGYHQPVDTRFTIRIELAEQNSQGNSPMTYAGVDAVVISDISSVIDLSSLSRTWNLGEDDTGATAGNTANTTTEENGGGQSFARSGDPSYSSEAPSAQSSTLSMDLDGDDYYQISGATADTIINSLDLNNLGISIYARPTALDSFNFVIGLGGNTNGGNGIAIFQQNGKWGVIHQGQASSLGTIDVTLNNWVHLELKRQDFGAGVKTQLFVNGVDSGASISSAPSSIQSYVTLGANQLNTSTIEGQFKGQLDLVKMGTATAPQGYTTFITAAYPDITDLATIGTDADPDGDGRNNGLEFLYQSSPSQPNHPPLSTMSLEISAGEVYKSTWPLDAIARHHIYWEIQGSSDMENWTTLLRSTSFTTPDNQPVEVVEPSSVSPTRRFHRLYIPQQN